MIRHDTILALIAGILVSPWFAGCLSGASDGTEDSSNASRTMADSSNTSSDDPHVGQILGLVTDEEQMPVANATILLQPLEVVLYSTIEGRFEVRGVSPGKYDVSVSHPRFQAQARFVDVRGGETSEVKFILQPVPVLEPHMVILPRVFYHNIAVGPSDQYLTVTCNVQCVTPCEGCWWNFTLERAPTYLMFELSGTHAIQNPIGPPAERVFIYDQSNDYAELFAGMLQLPGTIVLGPEQLAQSVQFDTYYLCNPDWFCFQEKRELWVSAFFDMTLPPDYSARQEP